MDNQPLDDFTKFPAFDEALFDHTPSLDVRFKDRVQEELKRQQEQILREQQRQQEEQLLRQQQQRQEEQLLRQQQRQQEEQLLLQQRQQEEQLLLQQQRQQEAHLLLQQQSQPPAISFSDSTTSVGPATAKKYRTVINIGRHNNGR